MLSKDYTYHVQNVIYILFYRECEPKNEFVCMHMHGCIYVTVFMHVCMCLFVYIFVRYKLEQICHSWLICIYLCVVKVNAYKNVNTFSPYMYTVHDFMQCINKLRVHYENEMQMLNIQIGLDSL